MVYEYEYPSLYEWLVLNWIQGPVGYLLIWLPLTLLLAALVGFLVALVRYGPMAAGEKTYDLLAGSFMDLVRLSPRRVYAVAKLVVLEAWRRHLWVVLVIYLLLLLFAGRYITLNSQDPAKLSISFVLSQCMRYLVLLVMLIISVFSIPLDFKNKTIYTVVTKPVRTAELVLGRWFGFAAIGTILLAVMGLFGYLFLLFTLQHTHDLELPETVVQELAAHDGKSDTQFKEALTSTNENLNRYKPTIGHKHRYKLNPDQNADNWTEYEFGHRHQIVWNAKDKKYEVAEPDDLLQARVQHVGKLSFKDARGADVQKGVNVGKEWKYRTFIEGRSPWEAIWTFENVSPERYPQGGITIERTLRVFRTEQAKIDEPLEGSMMLRNPTTGTTSKRFAFRCKDNIIDSQFIPNEGLSIVTADGKERSATLYDDFVDENGRLQIIIKCDAPRQYFGMAARDLYLREPNRSFFANFLKGVLCIWLQMLIIISCGILFSTFVSALVALLATAGFLFLGLYTGFIQDVTTSSLFMEETARGKTYYGGGPIESFYRMVTQTGVTTPLDTPTDPNFGVKLMRMVDTPMLYVMHGVNKGIPNFDEYDTLRIVGQGFDVPDELLAQLVFKALYFSLAAFLLGLGFMRIREVAK
ncbi:MAG: hypothetical protein QM811_01815 [Pirellulales bacterium]